METTKTVRLMRRRNLGNFEHMEFEISDSIAEGQNRIEVVRDLKTFVKDALFDTGAFAPNNATTAVIVKDVVKETVKEAVKKSEAKAEVKAEVKKEEVKAEVKKEEVKTEVKAEVKTEEVKKEEVKTEAKAEVKTEPKKKETKVTVKATKVTAYDRTYDPHKNTLGLWLDSTYPGWRNNDYLAKASAASKALIGKEFLDVNGDVLDSFKEAFSAMMK